jgi:hypothetical protein
MIGKTIMPNYTMDTGALHAVFHHTVTVMGAYELIIIEGKK